MKDYNYNGSRISKLSKFFSEQIPIEIPNYSFIYDDKVYDDKYNLPPLNIDEEKTFAYQMQQQTNQIIEKSNEQIHLLKEHNEKLVGNYKKLEDLYNLKEKELEEAKQEAKKSKRYNTIMMIISVASMMIAAAAWLLPNILGGVS